MRHGKKTVKLGRTASHRDAMLSNMACSLFLHEKIMTTSQKAKALRPIVDKLISTAKQDTLHAKRQVARTIKNKEAFKKLFREIIPQMNERTSGYSRVLKAGFRKGDGAELSVVELLIERQVEETPKKKEGKLKKLAGKMKKAPADTKEKTVEASETAEVKDVEAEVKDVKEEVTKDKVDDKKEEE